MIILNTIFKTIIELTFIISITLILNYLLNKDFKILINKIKRVALNHRKVNKTTQIKKLLYNYFFID